MHAADVAVLGGDDMQKFATDVMVVYAGLGMVHLRPCFRMEPWSSGHMSG